MRLRHWLMHMTVLNDADVSNLSVLAELSQTTVGGVSLNTPKEEPLRLSIQEGKSIS